MASRKAFLVRNLEDVEAHYPDDGDSLVWVAASGLWQPVAISGGGAAGGDFTDLDDVPSSYATFSGYYVKVTDLEDGLEFSEISDAGASAFTDLSDVPGSYSGEGGKLVVVKSAEDGLEFVASGAGGGASTFLDLSDTPSDFSGQAGKAAIVNDGEDALEFVVVSGLPVTAIQKSIFTAEASAQDAHTVDGTWEYIVAMSGIITLDEPGILQADLQTELKYDNGDWEYYYLRYQIDHTEMGTFYSPTFKHQKNSGANTTEYHIEELMYVWSGVVAGDFTVRTQWMTTSNMDISFYERQFTIAGEWEVTGIPSLDHGELDGLADDDHTQYLLADGSRIVSGGLAIGAAHPQTLEYGHLFIHDASNDDYGFIEADGPLFMASNCWYDGTNWRAISLGNTAVLYVDGKTNGLIYRADDSAVPPGAGELTIQTTVFQIDLAGNVTILGDTSIGNSLHVGLAAPVVDVDGVLFLSSGASKHGFITNVDDGGNIHIASNAYFDGTDWRTITAGKGSAMCSSSAGNTLYLLADTTARAAGGVLTMTYKMVVGQDGYTRILGGLVVGSVDYDATGSQLWVPGGGIWVGGAGSGRPGDIGLEIEWDGTQSDLLSYNRNTSQYQPLRLRGSDITFNEAGTDVMRINAGVIQKYKNATWYDTYTFVPLTTYIRVLNVTGSSPVGPSTLTLSGLPNNVKAIACRIYFLDTGSGSNNYYLAIGPNSSNYFAITARGYGTANIYMENSGVCPTSGASATAITYRIACGSGTGTATIDVYGYWI